MKTNRLFTLTAAALLSSAIGFAQAGAVDALKKFNNDAD
ncbi:MAG: outer membrane lipoprotein carrier protein LolA, partial [Neisseria sp.]